MSHEISSATLADFASISKAHPGLVTVVGLYVQLVRHH